MSGFALPGMLRLSRFEMETRVFNPYELYMKNVKVVLYALEVPEPAPKSPTCLLKLHTLNLRQAKLPPLPDYMVHGKQFEYTERMDRLYGSLAWRFWQVAGIPYLLAVAKEKWMSEGIQVFDEEEWKLLGHEMMAYIYGQMDKAFYTGEPKTCVYCYETIYHPGELQCGCMSSCWKCVKRNIQCVDCGKSHNGKRQLSD